MMPEGYTIRPTREADLEHLPQIEIDAAELFMIYERFAAMPPFEPMPVEKHREFWVAGRSWVGADAQDHPVGFAVISIVDGHAHLAELDVHPDHGRRGLGRALVETVCAWAKANGFDCVSLTTERDVPWNGPFYAKLGFEIVPEADWTDNLRRIIAAEIDLGLDAATRVVMRRALT